MNTTAQNQIQNFRNLTAQVAQEAAAVTYGETAESYRMIPGHPALPAADAGVAICSAVNRTWKQSEARPEALSPEERAELSNDLAGNLRTAFELMGLPPAEFLAVADAA